MNKTQVFNLHVKFQDTTASVIAEKILACIDFFENKKQGYKIYGKCSTFSTPRFVTSHNDYNVLSIFHEELTKLFKEQLNSITIVCYSKENGIVDVLRMGGKRDEMLLSELMVVDLKDVPVNT